jgi:K+-sensing histidine kinase KdpD
MAQRMNGELVAVHVVPQDGLAAPTAELLERQRELVGELGASYHEVVGEDIGDALLDAARSLNVTQIVMGACVTIYLITLLMSGSAIGMGGIMSMLAPSTPDAAEEPSRSADARPASLPQRRIALGFVLAVLGPPVLAYVLSNLRGQIGLPSVLLLFLLLVVWTAALGGLWPALLSPSAASCSSTGTSLPAAHVHDRARREHPGPGRARRRDDGQPLRRSRGQALRSRPKGAGRGGGAARLAARLRSRPCSTACGAC